MRSGTRIIAGAAALLILSGFFCPTICLADESTPSAISSQTVDGSPPCHDAAPEPAHDGSEPRSERSDCTHCTSAATLTAADWSVHSLDVAVAPSWNPPARRSLALLGGISARSHGPPARDLLLVKNSFLL